MLKRLLSRDTKGKVAKQARGVLEAETHLPAVEETPAIEPAVASAPPVPTPQVRRKAKSMRDSDVKDELGRSAEELAAEAALEFDIMGLAQRVKDMPDAPVAKPMARSSNSSDNGEFGVPGKAAVAPAAPVPDIQMVVPQPMPVTALSIEGGHILSPGPEAGSADATLLARDIYWAQFGESDEVFLTSGTGTPTGTAPKWPTSQQQFRIVRTESSLILASEGLSDPFDCFAGPADQNGYGQEVFIEVPGLQAATPDLIQGSWVFRAVEFAAQLIAHNGGICELLDQYGVMSFDVAAICAPRDWIVSGVAEPAGALLDVPMPRGRNMMAETPLSPVRVVPMTLIFPEELEDCVVGGSKERAALVNDLLTTGQGHKTDTQRASLR